jgi:hypothetical protein
VGFRTFEGFPKPATHLPPSLPLLWKTAQFTFCLPLPGVLCLDSVWESCSPCVHNDIVLQAHLFPGHDSRPCRPNSTSFGLFDVVLMSTAPPMSCFVRLFRMVLMVSISVGGCGVKVHWTIRMQAVWYACSIVLLVIFNS